MTPETDKFDKNQRMFAPIDMSVFKGKNERVKDSHDIAKHLKTNNLYQSMDEIIKDQLT